MKFTTDYARIPLDLFRELPPETWSERFFRGNEGVRAYVDARAAGVLAALGALPGASARPAWEIASAAGVRPERMREFRWILLELSRARVVRVDADGGVRSAGPADDPAEVRRAVVAGDPAVAAALDIVDAAAEGWPPFLRGEREGTAALFNARTLPLWDRYFSNDNPVYAASNRLGGFAAARALAEAAPGRPPRILEAGGGLGSGAEALLEALGEAPGGSGTSGIARYLFTEISPGFLRRGAARLAARFPATPIEALPVDLNRGLSSQGVAPASFDLVHAVNVLHAVRDLHVSLVELRAALTPGGTLVLVEGIRPGPGHPLPVEFVFGLLREFREIRRDPEYRPHGGFLEWPHWRMALERAGFEGIRTVPDFEAAVRAYPEHSLAAIVARRPGTEAAP